MTYNVLLEPSTLARLNSSITLPLNEEERVQLHFSSLCYSLGELVVTATNGDVLVREKTTGSAVDITEACKHAGAVKITAALVVSGEIVKAWAVEGLYVKEIDNVLAVIPEIENMRSEISLLKNALAELNQKINKISEI